MNPSRRQILLWAVALFTAAFALYAPSLSHGFVEYDDKRILHSQSKLFNQDSFSDSLTEIFADMPREEPLLLRDITWALDARIFGRKNAFGYHLGNVLLNAFNVALQFIFLLLATKAFRFSLISAALWGVLVVHVEPVCWVMGRKDVLSTFFMLGALIGHLCFLQSSNTKHRTLFYLLALLCTAAALYSKMSALPLFGLLGLLTLFRPFLDGQKSGDSPIDLGTQAEKLLPLIPHTVLCIGVYLWYSGVLKQWDLHHSPILGRGPEFYTPEHMWTLIRILPMVMAMYLKYIFSPFQRPLAWDWPNASIPFSPWEIAGSLLIAAAMFMLMLRLYKTRKDLFFAAAAFFVLMIPYMNIEYIGIWIANRYAYFSSACLVCILVWLGAKAYARSGSLLRRGMLVVGGAYFVFSCLQSINDQQKWHSERSFWEYEIAQDPPSILSTQNIARINLASIAKLDAMPIKTDQVKAKRQALIAQAQQCLAKGIQNYAALGVMDDKKSNYYADQRAYHAKHHFYLGRYANLNRESLQEQLKHYQRAFDLGLWNNAVLFAMGDTHINLAAQANGEKRRKLAHKALDFYKPVLLDQKLRGGERALALDTLQSIKLHFPAKQYPALQQRLAEMERKQLQ